MNEPTSQPAEAFLREFLHSETLRQRLLAVMHQPKALDQLLASEGYQFTRQELKAALARLTGGGGPMPDEALDQMNGGAGLPVVLGELRELFKIA